VLPPLFFSYAGFESLAQTAGETKEARRSLPAIFINGILISMVIFFLMSLVAFGTVPYSELAKSSYAMSDAAHTFLPWWGGAVVTIGALMAFSTSLNATLFVPSRILYVLGEDRLLPQSLARISVRSRIPWVSLVVNTTIALVLLWTKSFRYALDVALVAMFVYYGLHSASLIALPFVRPRLYETANVRLRRSLIVPAGIVSVISMGYLTAASISADVLKLLAVWVGIGTTLYAIARWEGKRSGFDYKLQLVRDWIEE
jgi:amino acid transporter